MLEIRTARADDLEPLSRCDRHVTREELGRCIQQGRVYVAEQDGLFAGWLRYGLFWDSIPFLNMLYLLEERRGQGIGTRMMQYWEDHMRRHGYAAVMTSTQSNEAAQHFYYRLGYVATGGFLLPGEAYELILSKTL